jgi:hypothetical protein
MTTAAPIKLRVKSAQDAIDLLYRHFIQHRHRPAINPAGACYAMPLDATYPRCALAIQLEPSTIRDLSKCSADGTIYINNDWDCVKALERVYGDQSSLVIDLQRAHDAAARPSHADLYGNLHRSFRAAFAASLRILCTQHNLQYPGDTAHD